MPPGEARGDHTLYPTNSKNARDLAWSEPTYVRLDRANYLVLCVLAAVLPCTNARFRGVASAFCGILRVLIYKVMSLDIEIWKGIMGVATTPSRHSLPIISLISRSPGIGEYV